MNLEIDWTRCDGHGLCAQLLPNRIAVDEWGFPVIANSKITPTELTDTRRTVGACPALALRLVDSRPAR